MIEDDFDDRDDAPFLDRDGASADQSRESGPSEKAKVERITMKAEITGGGDRALDPQRHQSDISRDIAVDLCGALSKAYGKHEQVRPETLAVAVQTVLETLLSGIEREGVNAATMRVALANSLLVNGQGSVEIDVNGQNAPSAFAEVGSTIH